MRRLIPLVLLFTLLLLLCMASSGPVIKPTNAYAGPGDGFLVLNEIGPWPSDGIILVELANPSDTPCPLAGWSLTFLSGTTVAFPANAPDCPPGGFVLVSIGPGAANPILENNCVKIHIPVIAGTNPSGDGCTLSGPDGPSDALSWGDPPVNASLMIPAGAPLKPVFEVIHQGDILIHPGDILMRLPNALPPALPEYIGSQNWAFGTADDASFGLQNPLPAAAGYKPADGARIASAFHITVMGLDWAVQANFQIANDENFESIAIDETIPDLYLPVSGLEPGTYYWRVRCSDQSGAFTPWSAIRHFIIEPFDIDELIRQAESGSVSAFERDSTFLADSKSGPDSPPGLDIASSEVLEAWHVIGCNHLQQRKDTDMVCLDGCTMNGRYPWDESHAVGSNMGGGHKGWYCSRACIAMIGALGGCTLSQDRVTYYIFEEAGSSSNAASSTGHLNEPEGDLGHDTGINEHDICMALNWLYRSTGATAMTYSASLFDDGDPSDMDTIREFIDDGRPVIRDIQRASDTHSTLIDGYAIIRFGTDVTNYVHALDPWSPNDVEWEAVDFDDTRFIEFPPTSGSPNRCDEATIGRDSDGDGLVDFDEINRFHTDPNHNDSDGDGIPDKLDILGYVFNPDGSYSLRDADIDGDDVRKERDPDNDSADDSTVNDGCEDYNLDGFFNADGRETDCFDVSDDGNVVNPYCSAGFIRIESEISMPAFPGFTLRTFEEMIIDPGAQITSTDMIHDFIFRLEADPLIMPPISVCADGEAEGRASLRMSIDEGGHYTIRTDCDPRMAYYQIYTTGPGIDRVTSEDFYLGFGDHHYDYVSPEAPPEVWAMLEQFGPVNVFQGQIERDANGIRWARGEDVFPLPSEIAGMAGSTKRTWEIRLDRLPSR